jgi:hypothetical protein
MYVYNVYVYLMCVYVCVCLCIYVNITTSRQKFMNAGVKIDSGGHIAAVLFHFLKSLTKTLRARKLLRRERQVFPLTLWS